MSYKRLTGVEENLAALYDHALYCQVLPDVLGLAYFVVHDSINRDRTVRDPVGRIRGKNDTRMQGTQDVLM